MNKLLSIFLFYVLFVPVHYIITKFTGDSSISKSVFSGVGVTTGYYIVEMLLGWIKFMW